MFNASRLRELAVGYQRLANIEPDQYAASVMVEIAEGLELEADAAEEH